MAAVDFCPRLCVFIGVIKSVIVISSGNCDIPADSDLTPEANKSPLRFTISAIQSEPSFVIPPVGIESHLYTVKHCFMNLYVLSKSTQENALLKGVQVSGMFLTCKSLDGNPSRVSGAILRYFNDSVARPEAVPVAWYQGGRIVIGINFFTFPETPSLKLRCGVKSNVLFDAEIFADMTITKVGCPQTKWGTRCQTDCFCQNGGVCHTFDGTCICPDPYGGVRCEIDFASTASAAEAVNSTGSSSANMPTTTQVSTSTSPERSTKGVVASGSFSDDINSSSHLTGGVNLLICGVICLIFLSLF